MIIQLKNNASKGDITELMTVINSNSISHQFIEDQNIIVLPKNNNSLLFKNNNAVQSVTEIDTPFQLAHKAWKSKTSFVVNDTEISTDTFNIIAGPCSIENEEQIYQTAEFLSKLGIRFIRGGAFKPRTSPYSFRGLGVDGLKLLHKAAKQYDLNVVTEILDLQVLDDICEYADILQVGSRNMQNFYMLNELGKINKPVLLKRGMSARAYEWLLAAEYILSGGNEKVILCERGIRSFDPQSRNVMDLGVIPLIKELSHLPIIADPSHGTGISSRVKSMALAATAAGADGLIVEIHPKPSSALSDKEQALTFGEFEDLVKGVNSLLPHLSEITSSAINNVPSLNLQSL